MSTIPGARYIGGAAVALTAVVAAQTPPPPPAPPPALVKVVDDVYVVQNVNHVVAEIGQNGGNATILLTSDGVVLIDTKNDRVHDDLVAKVKSLTEKPIRYAVLTHSHADHSGGAAKLQAMGVKGIFLPGSSMQHIVEFITANVRPRAEAI